MDPKLHACLVLNPTKECGHPLVIKPHPDLEEKSVNEQGLVVETSFHSINKRHEGFGRGDRAISLSYQDGGFLLADPY
jgi:hypothetical protein